MTTRDALAGRDDPERGSTLPLILGFFLVALIMVAGAIALGQAFVQQRDLQDICDGAASAAAASSADLDRERGAASGTSLRFADVHTVVADYLRRDPARARVRAEIDLSDDARRITVHCIQTRQLGLGRVFGRGRLTHTATSSARAAVIG